MFRRQPHGALVCAGAASQFVDVGTVQGRPRNTFGVPDMTLTLHLHVEMVRRISDIGAMERGPAIDGGKLITGIVTALRATRPPDGVESAASRTTGIQLETTPQPFGGRRWWFVCPRAGRRAAKLYLPNGVFTFASRQA